MKITKFAQSCVLIETKGKRILVDPGYLEFDKSLLKKGWNDIDILLVTHKHGDHCYDDAIIEIVKNLKTEFYTTKETAKEHSKLNPKIIKQGDVLKFGSIKVTAVKMVHGYIPLLKGREVKEGVGYIIDDGSNKLYLAGDIICFDNDYKCDVVFVPVCNHGVVMGPYEAALFAKETGAKLVLPYHYDNLKYPTDLKQVKQQFEKQELNYKILKIGESVTI